MTCIQVGLDWSLPMSLMSAKLSGDGPKDALHASEAHGTHT